MRETYYLVTVILHQRSEVLVPLLADYECLYANDKKEETHFVDIEPLSARFFRYRVESEHCE